MMLCSIMPRKAFQLSYKKEECKTVRLFRPIKSCISSIQALAYFLTLEKIAPDTSHDGIKTIQRTLLACQP